MKRSVKGALIALILLVSPVALGKPALLDEQLLAAFENSLKIDTLDPYFPGSQDAMGGFIEDRSSTWAPSQVGDKFLACQARYVWTASRGAAYFARDEERAAVYRDMGRWGLEFLNRMWGADYSGHTGLFMCVDPDGANGRLGNKSTYIVYSNAFAIFGAAAYYRVSGDPNALSLALDTYAFLEEYAHDATYGGYVHNDSSPNKDSNVNMHVLEGLVELYFALPVDHVRKSQVAERIRELLDLFYTRAIQCPTETACFVNPMMEAGWTTTATALSPGHNFEMSFLMAEALEALGEDVSTHPYLDKMKKLVDFTMDSSAVAADGAVYYTGTYTNGNVTLNDKTLQWWPPAEALGATCLMRRVFPNESRYPADIALIWSFIEAHIIDPTNHGWVNSDALSGPKASEWHENYHQLRALLNCLRWLKAECDDADGDGTCDHCTNAQRDGDESDVDCGGSCAACPDNGECQVGVDCASGVCCGGNCRPPTCNDGVRNGAEVGPDCGGPCSGCIPLQRGAIPEPLDGSVPTGGTGSASRCPELPSGGTGGTGTNTTSPILLAGGGCDCSLSQRKGPTAGLFVMLALLTLRSRRGARAAPLTRRFVGRTGSHTSS